MIDLLLRFLLILITQGFFVTYINTDEYNGSPEAFRVYNDVLSKGKTDLLFVEAAVNDRTNAYPAAEQVRSMEGIVRQARIANPATDIIFMYFADPDKINDYNHGLIPSEIVSHEKVAE